VYGGGRTYDSVGGGGAVEGDGGGGGEEEGCEKKGEIVVWYTRELRVPIMSYLFGSKYTKTFNKIYLSTSYVESDNA
jgi:hypothetical protein